ncbi:hypothetical protein VNO80_35205 [Phaseolus coccineus]|uniref:Uncharacterized protein n=1 Tax=Phaseolus coccineus TaxID=3886 RepID=A0AAN9KRZ1_PHACN
MRSTNIIIEVRQRKGYSDQIDADWILRFLQEYGVWKKTVFDRNSLHCFSSFFAASEITAPWVLFKASSSVASLLSLSLSTSNGLEKGPFIILFIFASRMLGSLLLGFRRTEGWTTFRDWDYSLFSAAKGRKKDLYL